MDEEYHKCNQEQGFCKTLCKRVKAPGSGGYGFFEVQVLDLEKRGVKTIGVNYKESAKDRGVMLNNCPYCGEKIDWFRDGRKEVTN